LIHVDVLQSMHYFLLETNAKKYNFQIELSRGPGLQSSLQYILPEGGVREGLAGKYVLVRRLETKATANPCF